MLGHAVDSGLPAFLLIENSSLIIRDIDSLSILSEALRVKPVSHRGLEKFCQGGNPALKRRGTTAEEQKPFSFA